MRLMRWSRTFGAQRRRDATLREIAQTVIEAGQAEGVTMIVDDHETVGAFEFWTTVLASVSKERWPLILDHTYAPYGTVEVELHAFNTGGVIRRVKLDRHAPREDRLAFFTGQAFQFGQNDFQPMPVRSVSVGDIVRVPSDTRGSVPSWSLSTRHIVESIGFKRVPDEWIPPADFDPYLHKAPEKESA